MMLEAVIINAEGKEIDSIDPVQHEWITETDTHWIVSNGAHTYHEEKLPGYRLEVREMPPRHNTAERRNWNGQGWD
jgi:hypothetical protein